MACFDFIKSTVILYINNRLTNRNILTYLADLFKLFILLNYVYFAYMIFAHLFHILNNMFECRKAPTYSDNCRSRPESRRESRERSRDRRHPPCTCVRSKERTPPMDAMCSKSVSACDLFPKPKSGRSKSGEMMASSSSIDRIKVDFEFNCKPKKSKRNRDGREGREGRDGRMVKSRSCTKCGKNLVERGSKNANRSGAKRRRVHCSDSGDEFGLRR